MDLSPGRLPGNVHRQQLGDGGSGDYPFFPSGSQEAEAQPALYAARTAADGTEYTMIIRDDYYGGVRYYPYRLTDGQGRTDEAGKLAPADETDGILPLRRSGYRVSYVPGGPEDGFIPLTGELAEEEDRYRAEVIYRSCYLEVPNRAREVLEPLLNTDNWEILIEVLQVQIDAAEGARREELEETLRSMREIVDDAFTLEDIDIAVELPEDAVQYQWPLTAAARTAALLAELAAYDPDTPAMEEGRTSLPTF